MLNEHTRAVVQKDSYELPAIFKMLAAEGQIEEEMMYNTFNMGIGMVLGVDAADADKTLAALSACGEDAFVIGAVEEGEKGVELR